MAKPKKGYCPRCGCPTDVIQCTDGTVEVCRDISCPWSKDNGTTVRLTLRNREQSVIVTEPTGNPEIYDYDPEYKHRRGFGKGVTPRRGR